MTLLTWVAVILCGASLLPQRDGGGSDAAMVKFSRAPPPLSASPSAAFAFEGREGGNGGFCSNCYFSCKLDNYSSSSCNSTEVTYTGLHDGNHTFEVCMNGSRGAVCAAHNWVIDTVPPTAYVSTSSSFTNASNASVYITFSEPCSGGGGFRCSESDCDLLVYGAGHVIPSTLEILQPGLEYSLVVGFSNTVEYGRLVLVMDKNFCTDAAGNRFTRTPNSSFTLHFDRRNVLMNITTGIPPKLLQLNGMMRTVEATNNENNLRIYLSFSAPVLNSSTEILRVLRTSSGSLSPTYRNSLGNHRFGYIVENISSMAIVTISCDTSSIISRQGTPVSSPDPFTFLYDAQRPSVKLTTSQLRTREHSIPVLVKFVKPVFDFNSSAISISGGQLLSFHEASKSIYAVQIHARDKLISVEVAENATQDVAGNKNLASNLLQVRHYTMPALSLVVSVITTVVFLATAIISAVFTVSTSSLISSGVHSRPATYRVSEPSRSLVRIACFIQVFALSRWLVANLPIEYYEFARGVEWTIPYFRLPWESDTADSLTGYPTFPIVAFSELLESTKLKTTKPLEIAKKELHTDASLYDAPLTPMEYRSFLENQNMKPEPVIMASQNLNGWSHFGRNMFWLAVIGGGLVLLHATILFVLRLRKNDSEKQRDFGALVFPRFEVFLIILALPCVCQASAALIRGRSAAGIIVGVILLGIITSLLISLLLFLSLGITMAKLLQYKEVHREGQEFHWYQEIIRMILGPGKRGQWTWKAEHDPTCLTKFGPLFEDLRGPPKYMLSQFSGESSRGKREDRIIASEDETEDAEAPFIQKLFGILRIYYTFLQSIKRVALGVMAGARSPDSSSKVPTLIILSITSFQLFFLILKKPFIKKRVQFVEIISVASEVGVFGSCLILLEKDFSDSGERRVGFFMLAAFVLGYTAQIINEWYALYRQVILLSPDKNSFSKGLKAILYGLVMIAVPAKLSSELLSQQLSSTSREGDGGLSVNSPSDGQMRRSSGTSERSWIRQLRELAKASFSRDDGGVSVDDPSTSNQPRRSGFGFWSGKRSRSSSVPSSSDFKAKGDVKGKSRGLYKDLEAIFSSSK
ncbi:uncharacterized protein LOC109717023 [Ananas comosus]|uniref:Uncharacterized protein LOC109717023 n=1 Tax=Ananas comosus TaxID=4615 RepID=A0A6P5FRE3_ANACO|nr:uncharacterized protein LOC109717023 [Ananas comosus]